MPHGMPPQNILDRTTSTLLSKGQVHSQPPHERKMLLCWRRAFVACLRHYSNAIDEAWSTRSILSAPSAQRDTVQCARLVREGSPRVQEIADGMTTMRMLSAG